MGCKFDGGDCCNKSVKGGSVKTTYCKECKCKDPKHPDDHKHACKDKCTAPEYIGDGICDDENNNCGCGFDKGDFVIAQSRVEVSKQPTAKNASARIPNTQTTTNMPVRTSAQRQGISAMVSATMRTTIAAAGSIKATVVIAQSKVEVSKQPTAKNASARIPNTQTTTNMPVRTSAQRQGISAMVSATMRTTIAAAGSIKATAVVPMSSKPTAKNASVNKRRKNNSRYVCVVGGLHVYDDSDIYCTIELG